jgi:hypothetical protein
MNKPRQSDGRVVPENGLNKSGETEAEAREGRRPAKRNVLQDPMSQTQSWTNDMPVVLERIRQAVRRNRKEKLTALYHHVYDIDHLREAYFSLQQGAAAGVDGVTWQQYGGNLETNLADLSARLRRGTYRAAPVRRVYTQTRRTPKTAGHPDAWFILHLNTRSLGISRWTDKGERRLSSHA